MTLYIFGLRLYSIFGQHWTFILTPVQWCMVDQNRDILPLSPSATDCMQYAIMHIGTLIFCSHCIWFFIASSLCLRCPGFVYWLFGFCPHPEWRQYFPCPNLALITIDHAFQIPVDVTPQLCSLWQTLDCRNYGNNYQQICNNEDTFWRLESCWWLKYNKVDTTNRCEALKYYTFLKYVKY